MLFVLPVRHAAFALTTLAILIAMARPGSAEPPQIQDVGAKLPWVSCHAKDGKTSGQLLESRTCGEIACESTSRQCVKLARTGDFVEWPAPVAANSIVVRHCIPDAPTGGGIERTITVVINGQPRQQLLLSSRHAWLYGTDANPQSNDPSAGPAHRFFDEDRALLTGAPLQAGDTIRLEKTAQDTADWYVIDLVDLEMVAPPAAIPEGYLSVADFGAKPNIQADDTKAIETTIAAAKADGKGVWFPAGTFYQREPIVLDHVKVAGAGPWYTRLTAVGESHDWAGNAGFHLTGTDVEIRDLMIEGTLTQRGDAKQHGLTGDPDGFAIQNLWIEHTDTGMWLSGCAHGSVRHCRVRNTYADGININLASHDVVVEENHVRNAGDDALVCFSGQDHAGVKGMCQDVTIRRNTAESSWWANGLAIYGGRNIVGESNLVFATSPHYGFASNTEFGSWPTESVRVEGNVFVNCGGNAPFGSSGGMFISASANDIKGLLIKNNRIVAPVGDGVFLRSSRAAAGSHAPELGVSLIDNLIESPSHNGVRIEAGTRGSLVLQNNRVTGLAPGQEILKNPTPPGQLQVTQEN